VKEAVRRGRHALNLYGGVLERYPAGATFNATDIRVLCDAIDDLIRARGRRRAD
jgi:hypothetical protein